MKHENPWAIHSIYELQYFTCPGCVYKNHSKKEFINHAYEVHPEAVEYLNNIDDGSLSDIPCPWKSSDEVKTEKSMYSKKKYSKNCTFEKIQILKTLAIW